MPVQILVVDDEPDLELMIDMSFSSQVKKGEYKFFYARNGVDALEKLEHNSTIDVVLTDINMPQMDGLTLLGKLNERYPLLRTVIISAYGDMSNIRTALNRGAFDFVTKPIDLDDLEATLTKTVKEAIERKTAIQNHEKLTYIQNELSVASRIQTSLLPRTFPPFPHRPEFDIHAAMLPAREVGGDFFDFFFVDEQHLGFVIGDVSGKGIPAALFMAVSRTFLKATALTGLSPATCLAQINGQLYQESVAGMFVTLFYGVLDTRSGEVRFCNGGHNLPYVLRKNGTVEATDKVGGVVVGAMRNSEYTEGSLVLASGDGLVLYTDGITEAMDRQEQEYAEARLEAHLKSVNNSPASEIIKSVMQDVKSFSAGMAQHDDMTMLTLRYLGT